MNRCQSDGLVRKFKILLIDNVGLAHYTPYLAYGLSKYHEVVLYGMSKYYYEITGAKNRKIEFHCIDEKLPKGGTFSSVIVRPLVLFSLLLGIFTKQEYDIVHIQGHIPMFFLFIPFLKLKGKKICWNVHEADLRPAKLGLRGKLDIFYLAAVTQPRIVSRFADAIIVLGSSIKDALKSKGVDEKKIHLVPHWDFCFLLDPKINPSYNYVLLFGRIIPYKGVDAFIDAAKIIYDQNDTESKFLIAGKWSNPTLLESAMKRVTKNVEIRNEEIPDSKVAEVFSNARMVVLPYTKASGSGVMSLAYTFSKPVIVSNLSVLTEFVEEGKTGLIFELGNTRQLAKCISDLLQDNSKCIEMGRNGHLKQVKEWGIESGISIINGIYEGMYP